MYLFFLSIRNGFLCLFCLSYYFERLLFKLKNWFYLYYVFFVIIIFIYDECIRIVVVIKFVMIIYLNEVLVDLYYIIK